MSLIDQQIKLLDSSLVELEKLKSEIKRLEEIRKDIEITKTGVGKLPEKFNAAFKKIETISKTFVESLGSSTKEYLDGNNTLFATNLSVLSTKIKDFEKEITRLVKIDFTKLFENLQIIFIEQTKKDLAIELEKFDTKLNDLQSKIDSFKQEVDRLQEISTNIKTFLTGLDSALRTIRQALSDIAIEFDAMKQTIQNNHTEILGDIGDLETTINNHHTDITERITVFRGFIENRISQVNERITEVSRSLNAIDQTLNSIHGALTGITQRLDTIEGTVGANHVDILKKIESFSDETTKQFKQQEGKIKKSEKTLTDLIDELSKQNESFKREVEFNRLIMIIGTIVLITIILVTS
jgi:chromosome segregation ATPase